MIAVGPRGQGYSGFNFFVVSGFSRTVRLKADTTENEKAVA